MVSAGTAAAVAAITWHMACSEIVMLFSVRSRRIFSIWVKQTAASIWIWSCRTPFLGCRFCSRLNVWPFVDSQNKTLCHYVYCTIEIDIINCLFFFSISLYSALCLSFLIVYSHLKIVWGKMGTPIVVTFAYFISVISPSANGYMLIFMFGLLATHRSSLDYHSKLVWK